MKKGFFITGTDTGVGKTFIAEGLIMAFRAKGLSVCPMKPAESGCSLKKGKLFPSDAAALLKASGADEALDAINPYRLKHPLAPAVAAELEGVKIEKKRIISGFKRLSKKYEIVMVEGAGGIMVPLYRKYLFLDLAKELGLPVVIVARPGLGTINHTLLTIEAVRSRGLDIAGVIINSTEKKRRGTSEKTNPGIIKDLGKVPLLGTMPYSMGTNCGKVNGIFRLIAERIIPG